MTIRQVFSSLACLGQNVILLSYLIFYNLIGASVSEPHNSLFNYNFSYIIIIWRTSFHISLML